MVERRWPGQPEGMDTPTRTRTNLLNRTTTPTIRFFRSRRLLGAIGALALIGLGAAHTITNAGGFAADPDASWPLFLIFGVGVSLVLWVIAVIVWRFSRRGVGRVMRVIIAVVGVLLCLMAANVLRVHPEIILSPAGPGLWSLIGGPALLTAALLPVRVR
ncbi:hypothetical protein SAMN05443544_1674 [Agromyces cerinus subsp. cerinus]|uniref:Uncharacterized protein n=2 Tax=Agromyces cerinus TaxID=33878 RepID=A0A1N6F244_9MICO|nr:hypothetical protein SAMN05443544_1674 [Agromyces cerinus subsp. cerinus]